MNAPGLIAIRTLTLLVVTITGALAHEGPAHVIARLSERIDSQPPSARWLVDRAGEHRVLGHSSKAIEDYRHALEHEPTNQAALLGLARCEVEAGRFNKAEAWARLGVRHAANRDQAGAFYALVATALERRGEDEEALLAWRESLESSRPEVDWFLAHAETLRRMDQDARSREALAAACDRNPSVVLHRAWIRSLIACEDYATAAPLIEAGLARSRFKSSWLVLRAQLHSADGESEKARDDARRALGELRKRYIPGMKNPILKNQIAEAEGLLASK